MEDSNKLFNEIDLVKYHTANEIKLDIYTPLLSYICTKCHIEKLLHAYYGKSNSQLGHEKTCRTCRDQTQRKKPPKPQVPEGQHFCSSCNISKPNDQFHKDKGKKDGLKSICKACRKPKTGEISEVPHNTHAVPLNVYHCS